MDKSLSKKQRKKLKMLQKQIQRQQQENKKKSLIESNEKKKQIRKDNQNKGEKSERKKSEGNVSIKSKQSGKSKNKTKKEKALEKKSQSQEQDVENNEDSLNFNNIIEGEQNVNVEFLISQINQKQYHSMKMILQKYARNTGIMSSQWADAIIANKKAGNSVLTQDDDEDEQEEQEQEQQQNNQIDDQDEDICNGVISILPYDNKLSKKLIQKVSKSVQNKKMKIHGSKQPSQLLTKNSTSVLICERAINLPYQIVKSMHQVLVADLKELKKGNSSEYSKICNQYILSLSQIQMPKGKKNEQVDVEEIIFTKFEDYLFLKNSLCWWIGQGSPNAVRKVPLHKLYFIISTQKYFSTVGQIHTLLDQNQ